MGVSSNSAKSARKECQGANILSYINDKLKKCESVQQDCKNDFSCIFLIPCDQYSCAPEDDWLNKIRYILSIYIQIYNQPLWQLRFFRKIEH